MSGEVREAARKAGDNPVIEYGARLGYAASGLLHLLIGWLAVQIGMGSGGKQASQSGALSTLAKQPFGHVLLWIAFAGFVLLGLWQLTELVLRHDNGDRVKAAGKAIMYAALAWTSVKFAVGGSSNSNKQSQDFTASMMKHSWGQIVIGLVGVAIVAIGGYHVYKGWKEKFLQDLQEHPGRWAVVAGRIGYIAKGIALIVVGGLFVWGAWHHTTKKATGLDGALRTLRNAPAGEIVLILVGLGIAAYGVYSFARARYARV